jgi:hypothetical protein
VEYARIASFVYGHTIARNRYENDGVGLGDPLGPDADLAGVSGTIDLTADVDATLSLARERHGAQRISTAQNGANPKGLAFPTEPADSRAIAELRAEWRPRVTRRVTVRARYEDDSALGAGWSGEIGFSIRADAWGEVGAAGD